MTRTRFTTQAYQVRGVWMSVQECRSAEEVSGTPVVLVHGLGLSHRYMMPTASVLARRHPTFVPDLPGFGDSGHPNSVLNVQGLADSLAAWLDAASLPPVCLLGNSFGCQIIADLAARHAARVDRAVLQGPTAPPKDRTWFRQWRQWRKNGPYNPPELGPMARGDYRRCGVVRLLVTFQLSLRDHLEDKLDDIAAPAMVVRGALDPICREGWAEAVADALPDGRLVLIPDAAHTLVYTAPSALAEIASAFFEEGRIPVAAP